MSDTQERIERWHEAIDSTPFPPPETTKAELVKQIEGSLRDANAALLRAFNAADITVARVHAMAAASSMERMKRLQRQLRGML